MPFPLLPLIGGLIGSIGGGFQQKSANKQSALDRALQEKQLQLQRDQFNRQSPGVFAGNAVRGDLLASLQPFKLEGTGRNLTRSGGLSPSLLSDNTRQLGTSMNRQALLNALQGPNMQPQQPQNPFQMPPRRFDEEMV